MNTHHSTNNQSPGAAVTAGLAEIERLLQSDPAAAEARASAFLRDHPGEPVARLYQAIALRMQQKPREAADILFPLCRDWPEAPFAHLQLGLARRETDDSAGAERSFQRSVDVRPDFADGWLALADLRLMNGDSAGADKAFAHYVEVAPQLPELRNAADALRNGDIADAEKRIRQRLRAHPNDVVALCLLADIAECHDQNADAERLLGRAVQIAPGYARARHNYAVTLLRRNMTDEALAECDRLLAQTPRDSELRKLRAAILVKLLEYGQSIEICRELLEEDPDQATVWTSLGHMLKSVGRRDDSIEAYRKAIALAPAYGEPHWSLANLKTNEMRDDELEAMRTQLDASSASDIDRIHFHFAMGKALEERQCYEESFIHYDNGNQLRRRTRPYDPAALEDHVHRSVSLFSNAFFDDRQSCGSRAADPIFVIGLPRSGSTLVEQILASHSTVEGTMELPDIAAIAASLDRPRSDRGASQYPDVLATLDPDRLAALGQSYLERTRGHRKLGTPSFVDKMPNNFAHLGLIHLILPNARIVDVRRHPLACGFSIYKELFAGAQNFSYSLEHIGQYYRHYLELMRHMDAVLPGRVHRVIYENLIDNTEGEVRRLLEYCGLPFEQACLNFHENRRPVNTASSEQVRQPIYRRGIAQWRRFEPWLSPLRESLGDALDNYRPGASD